MHLYNQNNQSLFISKYNGGNENISSMLRTLYSNGKKFCSITPTNLGQFSKPGTDLKSAGPDVFKTPPTCTIWPSFGWDIWGLHFL